MAEEVDESTKPEFIYGGPFIPVPKPSALLDTATPRNLQLQGTFKKSFAYYSLKERMPVILTKIIDYLSREGNTIKSKHNATDEDIMNLMSYITKLKNDLVTNKKFVKLEVTSGDGEKWNKWIENADPPYYFTSPWVFTECYVYRRLRDGCQLTKTLGNFDPFEEQKQKAFTSSVEPMCVVAEKVLTMLDASDKDKRKQDLILLLKLALWANKCDLSLSVGEDVTLGGSGPAIVDPIQMVTDLKDKILVDDSAKAADGIVAKAEAQRKAVEGATGALQKATCSCHRLAKLAGIPQCPPEEAPEAPAAPPAPEAADGTEAPKIPCPTKMTAPQAVLFDIVCDNSGYELFADLCLAHFLIAQQIVDKVRFHVKRIPWFVSDVTPNDFKQTLSSCSNATFNKEIPAEPKPAPAEGEAPPAEPPRVVTAAQLTQLGNQWTQYYTEGVFVVLCDDFWTSPHVYKDMKKYDPVLYRKLQFASSILFKGDLNYRKLLGERNCNPYLGFEAALQGFIPAPIIAARTVKADLICGLPKGKWDQLNKIDEKWMEKGDYGVIQFCAKAEALKIADRPCEDYGDTCRGTTCPIKNDM